VHRLSPPVRRVGETELRRIFNELGYFEAVLEGELTERVERSGQARPGAGQPAGTESQTVWYYDGLGQKVALVHQYLLPDGSIGGSGRPDPKRLIFHHEILIV
jgi:hypothetical protein